MNAIEIDNLSKTYSTKRGAKVEALKGINLNVDCGEVFGFLGPNGAGKSTTIKILMGLIRASGGSARLMGKSVGSHLSRCCVGFLPENPAFYDYLNGDEYLRFVGGVFDMDASRLRSRSEEVLRRLDLWDARGRIIRSYSKGMVQRLGIAQVLLHDPDIYLLDEPMSGLDPVGRALVKQIIVELKQNGKTVFFSTHITSDVEEVCDRLGIIVEGELKRIEGVESILTQGIEGYDLRFRRKGSKEESRQFVTVAQLTAALESFRERGEEVILVEPRREGLENFFLSILKEG